METQAVRICNQDIGMDLAWKNDKWEMTNDERNRNKHTKIIKK